MSQLKVRLLVLIIAAAFADYGFALDSDKTKVMHVEADSADLNQEKHRGVYIGNVQFEQGSTVIQAAKALTQASAKNELILAIAEGNQQKQAHYWTQSEPGAAPFHAYADSIHYYPLRHLIELKGHARVEQGKNSLSAALITYDTLKKQVISKGDTSSRTTIIYYPEKKQL